MRKKNKNVALGAAKENNGSMSNISNSFPPSLGWQEANGTFWVLCCSWCFCRPGLQAFHGVQKTLPLANDLQKTSTCTRKHLFRITSKTSCSTALQLRVFCSSPRYPAQGLSNTFGKWHWQWCAGFTPLTGNCPKHLGANYFEKSHAVGAVKELCKKITPFSLQLKQGVKQKIFFQHTKRSW